MNSKKINFPGPADKARPGPSASMVIPPANDTNGSTAAPTFARDTNAAADGTPPIYLEDLADFDDFDFGGAALGGKFRANIKEAAKTLGQDRPLTARDLSRQQQSGLRSIEARPLPLRARRRTSRGTAPPAIGSAKKTEYIEPRPLPLRPRRNSD